jgi:Tfp pilus assembly protein PilF
VAEARSDLALAEQHYRAALDKAPENAIALNNLAYVLAQQPSRAAEALPLIEKALDIYQDQPDFLDTYGLALLAAGRAADAEEAFRRALDLRPDEPSFMLSLATAHLEQRQTDHAAVLLDQVERRSTLNAAQRQRLHDLKERLGAAENTPSTAAQPTSSSN